MSDETAGPVPDDGTGGPVSEGEPTEPAAGGGETVEQAALADTAVRAVAAAGEYLTERFHDGGTDADYTATDVKTAADREAESRVLATLRESYPDHAVSTEERGDHEGTGYRWVVDPLDGTNNFAAGIPTFGVAATACEHPGDATAGEPVATAVGVPVLEDCYVATRDGGVRFNGTPVSVTDGDTVSTEKATVGMFIGPEVVSGGQERREWDAISRSVEGATKRAIQTWAPVVYYGLFARGKLDGFVCYYPAEREQVAGELLASEAGAVERSDGPLTVFADDESTRDALWDAATDGLERAD
jgi:myo-inositol-1(or 4)-monophosphatase